VVTDAFVVVGWLLAVGMVASYGYLLQRFERGRKVSLLGGSNLTWNGGGYSSTWMGPRRSWRLPTWYRAIAFVWVLLLIGATFVVAETQLLYPNSVQRPWGVIRVMWPGQIAVCYILGLLVLTERHNRGAVKWPPPGWYADMSRPELMRWWNGVEWLDYTFPKDRFVPDPMAEAHED